MLRQSAFTHFNYLILRQQLDCCKAGGMNSQSRLYVFDNRIWFDHSLSFLSFGATAAEPDICAQQQMEQVISLSQHSPKTKAEPKHGPCLGYIQLIRLHLLLNKNTKPLLTIWLLENTSDSSQLSSCSTVRPNVSIKAEMVRQRGSEYWVVSCVASGGTPDTDIFLAVDSNEELKRENDTDPDSQICSVHLPVAKFEGHNVTCVFKHPKFMHRESRVIALPTFCE